MGVFDKKVKEEFCCSLCGRPSSEVKQLTIYKGSMLCGPCWSEVLDHENVSKNQRPKVP